MCAGAAAPRTGPAEGRMPGRGAASRPGGAPKARLEEVKTDSDTCPTPLPAPVSGGLMVRGATG
ncbi:hypothetical protein SNL152K_3815 [Streptomyces sp. NL15-2K]|nr:hypothetical protein SNL152K_3815 [Streptomyces sp. NL15-2K]